MGLPILVIIMLIRYKLGSPVFYCHLRPGLYGKLFVMVKFRTMTQDYSLDGTLKSDEDRLTTLGQFLRSTSLDELPEFWNVLKGDMSLVGPRPLLPEYLPLYSKEQSRRHDVKPGITGLAQVNGRNAITWDEKFKFDNWYVDNHSFLIDLKIIFKTFRKVLMREGIRADGYVSMPRFTGNEYLRKDFE